MPNPFRNIDSRQVYDNPWITVIEDRILKPNGTEGIYGKVLFKQLAIGIVPYADNGDIWLVGQHRYTLDTYEWEIPSGGSSYSDTPVKGAQRELREETGLLAEHWEELTRIHLSNSVSNELGMVFLAQGLTEGETEFDDTEVLEIRRLPFAEALEMVRRHEITDSLSVVGILALADRQRV